MERDRTDQQGGRPLPPPITDHEAPIAVLPWDVLDAQSVCDMLEESVDDVGDLESLDRDELLDRGLSAEQVRRAYAVLQLAGRHQSAPCKRGEIARPGMSIDELPWAEFGPQAMRVRHGFRAWHVDRCEELESMTRQHLEEMYELTTLDCLIVEVVLYAGRGMTLAG